ncbi:hypothetical protein ACFV6E_26795 [Streptomyces sp. NPDC059785]|uniref:hypothetical protein n=1 Tax=unclassified Streptomyces TaxID=2593676 RepID=UPI00364B738C
MTTDLSTLTSAADRWDGMAGEFEKREAQYKRDVQGISLGQSWQGLSAHAADARFKVTLKEFQAAQTEARAVASLLRDAHTQFVALRGAVRTVRQEAIEAGLRVSERGLVSYVPGSSAGDRDGGGDGDRDAGDPERKVCASTASWQERLDRAVHAVGDADLGVEIALKAVVTDSDTLDGTSDGFNARAVGDVERYEAMRADDIARRLNNGEDLSARDLAELRRSFRDNSGDKVFARTFLDGLGAEGTIRMTNRLNDLVHVQGGAGAGAGTFSTIESGLAHTLATATRDTRSGWYEDWRADMRKAGVATYATDFNGIHLDKARGYQSLVTLMQHGDGYAPRFLEDVGDDIMRAEKSDPDIWDLKGDYAGKHGGWFANDPLDGLLGVMSHDPDTAASYLKSEDRMKYLTEERDWEVALHGTEGPKGTFYSNALDGDDRAGFGAALQAATTGIDPADKDAAFVRHTDDNNAVLRSSLRHLADRGDEFPASLREPMANILANHGEAVHTSASDIDMAHAPLKQPELFEVIKQVSRDAQAYGTLNSGINHAMVTNIHESDARHAHESLIRAGRTVGFLEEARVQTIGQPGTAEFDGKWAVDLAIGHLPVAGSEVQAGVDYVTEQWLADEQRRLEEKTSDEKVASYENRNHQLMALSQEWWKLHSPSNTTSFDVRHTLDVATDSGINRAKGVSGE